MVIEYSKTGARHLARGMENQDHLCSGTYRKNTVITLADGVSSCTRAKEGAEIAGELITELLLTKGEQLQEYEDEDIAEILISHILYELEDAAEHSGEEAEAYSSTVASVLQDRKRGKLLCLNLGDCIILGASEKRCRVICEPFDSTDGCCVTTTSGAEKETDVKIIDDSDDGAIVICSDGAWRHMFSRGKMNKEPEDLLKKGDFGGLKMYLDECGASDDASFIAMIL